MAVPKRKLSRHRVRRRRSAWMRELKAPALAPCPRCHNLKAPHHVCPTCGYYGNIEVIEIEEAPEPEKKPE
ncbi:MAG: 50S ribosomal protein L32 [bacterium JZ-2024 1]